MIAKLLLLCLSCSITLAAVPLTKCKLDDAKCIKASAQAFAPTFVKGNPAWGVEPLEPFFMKYVNASSRELRLELEDLTGKGMENCVIKKMQFDQATSKLHVKVECTVDFEGHYVMQGKIIFLKIEGNGHAHVVLRKALMSAIVDIAEVTGKDGLKHWSIKRYTHSYELKDKATIELENLFNGNEELGRVAKDLFASSPNDVVAEVGPPIIAAVVEKIVTVVNHFFKKVPLDDLIEY